MKFWKIQIFHFFEKENFFLKKMFFLTENRQKPLILLNLVHFRVHWQIPEVEPLLPFFFRLDRTKSAYFSAIFRSPIYPLNLLLSNSLGTFTRGYFI